MAIVNNKRPRLLAIPVLGRVLRLLPGVNEIDDKTLAEIRKIATIKGKFDNGVLTVEATVNFDQLATLNAKRACELIKNTFNRDLLARWRERDTRKIVLSAIVDQLKALENEPLKDQE